jgi:Fe-S oxidoreductase
MCPSYRVTRDERDVTRGRANTLRLAISGQLGPDALASDEMAETLKLCVSCKACRRECPTGVDMARMKIEVTMSAVEGALRLIPELAVETVESSCCGMAGSFGYDSDTIDVSLKMGELSLLPAVRKAADDTLIVADGTSCRHQIHDGADRDALHVARVLAMSLETAVI